MQVQGPRTALVGTGDCVGVQGPRCGWYIPTAVGAVPIVLSIGLHVILLVLVGSSLPSRLGKEVGWFQLHSLDYLLRW